MLHEKFCIYLFFGVFFVFPVNFFWIFIDRSCDHNFCQTVEVFYPSRAILFVGKKLHGWVQFTACSAN